jgi:hypothetical protein
LKGARIRAHIVSINGEFQSESHVIIYGLPLSTINQLTTIGVVQQQIRFKNTLQIAAGIEGDALTTIYKGIIAQAYGEFSSAPDVGLVIIGFTAAGAQVKPVGATSYRGSVAVSQIMADFAKDAGFTLSDAGVKTVLSNPYFSGTTLDKIKQCAKAAGIDAFIYNDVLSIYPKNTYSKNDAIELSPSTGLIGYPRFSSYGVVVQSIFNPGAFTGGKLTIKDSELSSANGDWRILTVVHDLESQVPNGVWQTTIETSGFYV